MQTEDDLLMTLEAAQILGIAPETVRLWERTGRLAAIRTARGVRLFRRAEIERVARARRDRRRSRRQRQTSDGELGLTGRGHQR